MEQAEKLKQECSELQLQLKQQKEAAAGAQ